MLKTSIQYRTLFRLLALVSILASGATWADGPFEYLEDPRWLPPPPHENRTIEKYTPTCEVSLAYPSFSIPALDQTLESWMNAQAENYCDDLRGIPEAERWYEYLRMSDQVLRPADCATRQDDRRANRFNGGGFHQSLRTIPAPFRFIWFPMASFFSVPRVEASIPISSNWTTFSPGNLSRATGNEMATPAIQAQNRHREML
ncbi:MAG: hypothetical protein LBQ81_04230 [Zoogloeaceae bacterium]|jgi:hypothetical protein|nr:hypothetical protein [Zoogloeaceae bacterium]